MTQSKAPRSSPLGPIFLIVFLDIAGFSIIFPLFPQLLEHYLPLEAADGLLPRLIDWLRQLAGKDENAVVTLFGAALGSLYAVMQFVFAPLWGGLSDRIGRRSTLLLTLTGTALGHALWSIADTFALLVIARLLGGAMAGNIATAAAAVADTSSGPERAKGMGIVGMAIGLGFILGPVLGGLAFADALSVYEQWPGGRAFGIHPFTTPALAALALSLLNLVWVARRLPETLTSTGASHGTATLRPFRRLRSLDFPGVLRAHWVYFVHLTAFAAMEFTLTFLAYERLDYAVSDITWMFVYTGLVIAVVQGGLVRRLVPRLGEARVARAGMIAMVPGFLLIGFAWSSPVLYAGLTLLAFGSGLTMPSLSALVSRYVPSDRQGLAQGTLRSLGSLSRAVGPALGGVLYWRFGSTSPYVAGAAVLVVPILGTLGLPAAPDGERASTLPGEG